jgi:hypothetical protein
MALRWVSTGVDENGDETGYNIDDSSGDVWDDSGNLLDQSTAQPNPYENEYQNQTSNAAYQAYIAENPDLASQDFTTLSAIGTALSKLGTSAFNSLKNVYTKDGATDWKAIAATAGGLYGLYQSNQPQEKTGYQGKIPTQTAVRAQVANTYDPNRRPGSTAQNYFSDTKYVAPDGVAAARTAATTEAAGLEALNKANPARQTRPVLQAGAATVAPAQVAAQPAAKVIEALPVPTYAAGGIADMAKGRYLGGATDGMADKIPASIDGNQKARLSHGEFVIPADVVGHLGNGNSEAGAQRLYAMMDKIRQARTGTTKQGKQINPNNFLPHAR